MSLFVSYHGNQLSNLKIDLIFEISVLTLCWAVTLREILQGDMILKFRPVTYLKHVILAPVSQLYNEIMWQICTTRVFIRSLTHDLVATASKILATF